MFPTRPDALEVSFLDQSGTPVLSQPSVMGCARKERSSIIRKWKEMFLALIMLSASQCAFHVSPPPTCVDSTSTFFPMISVPSWFEKPLYKVRGLFGTVELLAAGCGYGLYAFKRGIGQISGKKPLYHRLQAMIVYTVWDELVTHEGQIGLFFSYHTNWLWMAVFHLL